MRPILAVAVLAAAVGTTAQPLPSREELARIPLAEAVVLDPVGRWTELFRDSPAQSRQFRLEQADGAVRMTVADAGKRAFWRRNLAIPVDPSRYPIAVLAYRATALPTSTRPPVSLLRANARQVALVEATQIISDGTIHEEVIDLRELDPQGAICGIEVAVHCLGPEPATFGLLGLRFESDQDQQVPDGPEESKLSVRVVGVDRSPVDGAKVTVDAERLNASRSGLTDAGGRLTLPVLQSANSPHGVRVEKQGMATVEPAIPRIPSDEMTLVLARASHYGGVVQDGTGNPIASAAVTLTLFGSNGIGAGSSCLRLVAITDDQGRWQTPLLPVEGVSSMVELDHPDFCSEGVVPPPTADMQAGKAVFRMHAGALLRGRIVSPNGEPVPEALAMVVKEGHRRPEGETRSAADGTFAFDNRLLGTYWLVASRDGFAPTRARLELEQGHHDEELKLGAGRTLGGKVTNARGEPVHGASVLASIWDGLLPQAWSGTTDSEGRFAWSHAPDEGAMLQFQKSDSTTIVGYDLAPDQTPPTIVLPPALRVRGTVVDEETGEPIAGCKATPGFVATNGDLNSIAWQKHLAVPCAKGTCHLPFARIEYGRLPVIRVEAEGYRERTVTSIDLNGGEQSIHISLHRADGAQGVVFLPDGKPAAEAKLYLLLKGRWLKVYSGTEAQPPNEPAAATGQDGRYRLDTDPPVGMLVVLHPGGYCEQNSEICLETPDIQLQPWSAVTGTYRQAGKPLAEQEILFQSVETESRRCGILHRTSCKTDANGHFRFPRVPARAWFARTQRQGPQGTSGECRVTCDGIRPGQTMEISLGGNGRAVCGKVAVPAGNPDSIQPETARGSLSSTIPDLPGMHPFPTELRALPELEQQKRTRQWLKTDEGKAYTADQMRLIEAEKAAFAGKPRTGYGFTVAKDGTFRIEDVPPGTYRLSIAYRVALPPEERPLLEAALYLSRKIEVPEPQGGEDGGTLNLGTLTLNTLR